MPLSAGRDIAIWFVLELEGQLIFSISLPVIGCISFGISFVFMNSPHISDIVTSLVHKITTGKTNEAVEVLTCKVSNVQFQLHFALCRSARRALAAKHTDKSWHHIFCTVTEAISNCSTLTVAIQLIISFCSRLITDTHNREARFPTALNCTETLNLFITDRSPAETDIYYCAT